MKLSSFSFFLIFIFSTFIYAQEPHEKMVIVKGCQRLNDNLELKECFNKKISKAFSHGMNKKLKNAFNPGLNEFNIGLEVREDKKINLAHINSANLVIIREFEKILGKVKIVQPAIINGQAVKAVFNIPLKLISKNQGPKPIHKLTKIVDENDYEGNDVIYPEIEAYCNKENKEENFHDLEKYIKNFFFNSVDLNQIKGMLNPGMNFFEAKIGYNANDFITKIIILSSNKKLNAIFEKHLSKVFKKSGFKSPTQDDNSYAGEMTFYFFYMNS